MILTIWSSGRAKFFSLETEFHFKIDLHILTTPPRQISHNLPPLHLMMEGKVAIFSGLEHYIYTKSKILTSYFIANIL